MAGAAPTETGIHTREGSQVVEFVPSRDTDFRQAIIPHVQKLTGDPFTQEQATPADAQQVGAKMTGQGFEFPLSPEDIKHYAGSLGAMVDGEDPGMHTRVASGKGLPGRVFDRILGKIKGGLKK